MGNGRDRQTDRNRCREELGICCGPLVGTGDRQRKRRWGKTEDFDAMEVNEEMVQKSMVHGMESCRNTKDNED